MDEPKYLILNPGGYGAFVRGDIVTPADLLAPPDALIAQGDIRPATDAEAALGRVPLEALTADPPPQADENARARFATLQAHIDAAVAANPQRAPWGAAPPSEDAARAITSDQATRRLQASEVASEVTEGPSNG